MFNSPHFSINITEDVGQYNLQILRDDGVFGEVGALYLISSISTDAGDFTAQTSGVLQDTTQIYWCNLTQIFCCRSCSLVQGSH